MVHLVPPIVTEPERAPMVKASACRGDSWTIAPSGTSTPRDTVVSAPGCRRGVARSRRGIRGFAVGAHRV